MVLEPLYTQRLDGGCFWMRLRLGDPCLVYAGLFDVFGSEDVLQVRQMRVWRGLWFSITVFANL